MNYGLRKALKPLESLVNLVELEIQSNIEGCWIVHEPVNLMRLKKFTLDSTWTCEECLETLADSFESLQYFSMETGQGHCLTLRKFEKLSRNWHLVEEIDIRVDEFEFQEQERIRMTLNLMLKTSLIMI